MDERVSYHQIWTKEGHFSLTLDEYLEFDVNRLHRLDGPAHIGGGSRAWYVEGKVTRVDGPAVIDFDGSREWWLDDRCLSTEEVEEWIRTNQIDLTTIEGQFAFKIRWSGEK